MHLNEREAVDASTRNQSSLQQPLLLNFEVLDLAKEVHRLHAEVGKL